MNYSTAADIVSKHAPKLLLDPQDNLPHIVVRAKEDGEPFSIMLPTPFPGDTASAEDQIAAEAKQLTDALKAAANYLGR